MTNLYIGAKNQNLFDSDSNNIEVQTLTYKYSVPNTLFPSKNSGKLVGESFYKTKNFRVNNIFFL